MSGVRGGRGSTSTESASGTTSGAGRSERLLEAVFRNATVSLFVMDERQHCIYMNPAAEALTGYSLEEVQGRPLHDVIHHTRPDGSRYPLEQCPIDRAFPENNREQGEEVFVHKDGSFYPVAYTASPLRDGDVTIGTVIEVRDLSSEKEAERALLASEERFRTLVTTHAAVTWLANAAGELQDAPQWEAYTGQPPAESRGWGWLDSVHPEDRPSVLANWRRATDAKQPNEIGYRLRHRSGGYRFVLDTAAPLLDQHGRVREWIGVVTDVHDREEAKEALREAHLLLEAALAAGQVMTYVWDIPRDRVTGNASFARLFSLEPGSAAEGVALGQFLRSIHSDDRARVEAAVERALATGEPYSEDYRVHSADGRLRWVAARGRVEYDAAGAPLKFPGALVDITERKDAEAELRERNETLELIRRASLALGSELDLQQLVQTLTDIGVRMTGAQFGAFFYNVQGESGESYTLYTLSGAPQAAFAGYPMPRATHVFGPTFRGEGVVRSDDITQDPRYGRNPPHRGMPEGHLPVRSYLAVPVASRSGEVLGGLFFGHAAPGVFSANSERIITAVAGHAAVAIDNARLYEQARRFSEQLEREVQARTEDLQALNRELEAFNYSVSHDLRAPLRSLTGFSQLLLEEYGDELDFQGRQYLQRISRNAARMGELITALLELSRLARTPIRPEEVDLRELALATAADLREHYPSREVEVIVEEDLRARGDRALLQLALENLLENAWKYTRDRQDARVEVRRRHSAGQAHFLVRDNGAGFDMAYADRLFVPFQRLHSGSEFEGTGIGLATVQRIIHRHGGRVWAESAPGAGATFYFTLEGD